MDWRTNGQSTIWYCVCISYLRSKINNKHSTRLDNELRRTIFLKGAAMKPFHIYVYTLDPLLIMLLLFLLLSLLLLYSLRAIVFRKFSAIQQTTYNNNIFFPRFAERVRCRVFECKGNPIQAHFLYILSLLKLVVCCAVWESFVCCGLLLSYTENMFLFYSWNLIQLVFLGNGHTIIIQDFYTCVLYVCVLDKPSHFKGSTYTQNRNAKQCPFLLFPPNECDQMIVVFRISIYSSYY